MLDAGRGLEALALVDDHDDEPVGVELVGDLDRALAARVGVPDRVRAGLGQRELQVAEHLLAERLGAQACDPGQGEAAERDVLGLRRNREPDRLGLSAVRARPGAAVAVSRSAHRVPLFP